MDAETHAPNAAPSQLAAQQPAPLLDPRLDPHLDPQRPGRATGPRTAEGKARSSRNALKHGLTSNEPLVPEEDPAAFEEMRQNFLDELQPVGPKEETLAEIMILATWKLRRVWRMEPEVFANWRAKAGPRTSAGAVWALDCMADRALEKLSRYEAKLVRAFMQSEARLRLLQKLRAAGLERPYRVSEQEAGRLREAPAAGASASTDGGNRNFAKRTPAAGDEVVEQTAGEPQIAQINADERRTGNGAEGQAGASGSRDGGNGEIAKRTAEGVGEADGGNCKGAKDGTD